MPGTFRLTDSASQFDVDRWSQSLRHHVPDTLFISIPKQLTTALISGTLTIPTVAVPQPCDDTWFDGSPVEEHESSPTPEGRRASPEVTNSLPELTRLVTEIDSAICRLGGAVSPKLGTVAPSDATWVSFHRSTRCESASDVLTLIAASERVMRIADKDPPPKLALRLWIDGMDRSSEYRAFVTCHELVALSQRDPHAPSSLTTSDMDSTVALIEREFANAIGPSARDLDFGSNDGKYVFDVFVDRNWKVWLVDFAPWGNPTDALLYEWDELDRAPWMSAVNPRAQIRCISAESAIRPSQMLYGGMPMELRSEYAGDSLAEAARRLMIQDISRDSSDDSDSNTPI